VKQVLFPSHISGFRLLASRQISFGQNIDEPK